MELWKVLLIILAILVVAVVVLYFLGKRAQKKQEAQQEQIEAAKQIVPMLIIDKKRMPLKSSGLPQAVIDQTPKLMRRSKLPIVKAKVGPKIMTLVCDERIFDVIPLKKEVKATVSGIYITDVRGVRGALEAPAKKPGFFKRLRNKAMDVTTGKRS
jgi:type II secretory pathway pseudopilin PulG